MRLIDYAPAQSLQSCPALCDLMDYSPPGFSVPGILQARILEWVAISFSILKNYLCIYIDIWLIYGLPQWLRGK